MVSDGIVRYQDERGVTGEAALDSDGVFRIDGVQSKVLVLSVERATGPDARVKLVLPAAVSVMPSPALPGAGVGGQTIGGSPTTPSGSSSAGSTPAGSTRPQVAARREVAVLMQVDSQPTTYQIVPMDATFPPPAAANGPAAFSKSALPIADKPVPAGDQKPQEAVDNRVGGDTCGTATVIPSVPYSDTGTTVGANNDYDEVCPYTGSTAPDVVYSYTPAADETVNISLCTNSAYDTKLYVYEGSCSYAVYACNDDACSTPSYANAYVSALLCLDLTGGQTYYIVVDGYGTESGNYTLDITPCEAVECPANTLYGQDPSTPSDGWVFGIADANGAGAPPSGMLIQHWDDFSGVAGSICDLHWWGLRLTPGFGAECAENMAFQITFHPDAAGVPGPAVCTYTFPAGAIVPSPTGQFFVGFEMYEWNVLLVPCCTIANGWVSITATPVGDANCNFLWGSSGSDLDPGAGHWSQTGGGALTAETYDLSFCLTAPLEPGACCDDTTGICNENVSFEDCLPPLRFASGQMCADLVPLCGVEPTGACCFSDGTCQDLTSGACAAAGGFYQGDLTNCGSVNCTAACCLSSGACQNGSLDSCNAAGGTWMGFGSECGLVSCEGACCHDDGSCTDGGEDACTAAGGDFQGLGSECATTDCPLPNDTCDTCTQVGATPYAIAFDNSTAIPGPPPGSCNAGGTTVMQNDVWFCYTPPESCVLTWFVDYSPVDGTGYDGITAVYTGACNALTEFDCQDSGFGTSDDDGNTFLAIGGTTYWFQIGDWGASPGGGNTTFELDCTSATGACCIEQECLILSEVDCNLQGGQYLGDFSDCGETVYSVTTCGDALEDISASGTLAAAASDCDDCGDVVPIGFTFNYFGDDHTNVAVVSNGYLTFGATLNDFSNDPIPNANTPNDLLAVLWDDLITTPTPDGTVHYQTLGTAPNRRFIAQWTNVRQLGNSDSNTFQAVLFEGSNCIEYRYGTITPEALANDYTVGIENQDGTEGVSVTGASLGSGNTCREFCPEVINDPCIQCEECPPGTFPITDFQGDFAGWCIGTSHPNNVDYLVFQVTDTLAVMQISKDFDYPPGEFGFTPILLDFIQVCPDELSVNMIFISDEVITNQTGVPWTDFHWTLFDGGEAWFDKAASQGFSVAPFATKTFSDFLDPGENQAKMLTADDGVVPNNSSFFPGFGSGELKIGIDLSNEDPVSFTLKERPTFEAAEVGACCTLDGCVDNVEAGDCVGSWQGPDTLCADILCNDECEGRLSLPCNDSTVADTLNATAGADDPDQTCSGGGQVCTLFYEFVPTDVSARIRTDLNSVETDSVYTLYAVDQAAPCDESLWSEVDCSEDEGTGLNGDLCFGGLIPGNVYVLMISGFGAASCGEYTLDVECPCPGPPPGETCADCVSIGTVPYTNTVDNNNFAAGGAPGSCNSGSATVMQNDLWYCYTPAANCTVTWTADYSPGVSGYDGITVVWTGTAGCNSQVEIDCQDSGFGSADDDTGTFPATAGQTYWFQVGDWGVGEGGGLTQFDLDCQ